MGKYVVIGGQYQDFCYGFADTLPEAKRLASRSVEYWDNWAGWHYPRIYDASSVEPVRNFYGDQYSPKFGAIPVLVRRWGGRWRKPVLY